MTKRIKPDAINLAYNRSVIFLMLFLLLLTSGCQTEKPNDLKRFTNAVGMEFVYIPPGNYLMGSPEEESKREPDEIRHSVTLTRGIYMGITEVTQGQWSKVMGKNPSEFKACGDRCPVESVSWEDVQQFIQNLNTREGIQTYRLPTEAEWEYGCRAGSDASFSFGNCLSTDQANFDGRYPLGICPAGTYRKMPVPVASFPPNAYGLHDMHGNVWEWCLDWYGGLRPAVETDPAGPPAGRYKVVRGGSCFSLDHDCRSANRDRTAPDLKLNHIGLRLVMNP